MTSTARSRWTLLAAAGVATAASQVGSCLCQLQAGVYDFGQNRYGEKRGSWTPGEWLAGILLLMTILLGLAISIGLCYYTNKRQRQSTTRSSPATNYRRQQNLEISARQVEPDSATKPSPPREMLFGGGGQTTPNAGNKLRTPNDSLIVQI